MIELKEARKLATRIEPLIDLGKIENYGMFNTYNHIGAIITDTILQSGLNYRTIIKPRIDRILLLWPNERNTTDFDRLIDIHGLPFLINWNHYQKLDRIMDLLDLFLDENIDSEDDLRTWIKLKESYDKIFSINGIGFKTIDYLKKIIGIQSIPIDRHLINFAIDSGLDKTDYLTLQKIYKFTAELLDINYSILDSTVWNYMSMQPTSKNSTTV